MANHVLGAIDIKPDQNAYYFKTDCVMQLNDQVLSICTFTVRGMN